MQQNRVYSRQIHNYSSHSSTTPTMCFSIPHLLSHPATSRNPLRQTTKLISASLALINLHFNLALPQPKLLQYVNPSIFCASWYALPLQSSVCPFRHVLCSSVCPLPPLSLSSICSRPPLVLPFNMSSTHYLLCYSVFPSPQLVILIVISFRHFSYSSVCPFPNCFSSVLPLSA